MNGGDMRDIFDSVNIGGWQLVSASLYFFMAMLGLFLLKKKSQQWLNYALIAAYAFYWLITISGPNTFQTKLFVSLLFISTLTIGTVVLKKRRRVEADNTDSQ
jgi:apolipoprotein N-acyltransferase